MPQIISFTVTGDKEFLRWAKSVPAVIQKVMLAKVTSLTLRLEAKVKRDKLSGQVLRVRTGALRSSIFHTVTVADGVITGKVAAPRDVPYAAIHEFGGQISHPGGTAYFVPMGAGGKAAFVSNNKAAELEARFKFTMKRTAPHMINMPVRSFIRSSMADMKTVIESELAKAAQDAIKRK